MALSFFDAKLAPNNKSAATPQSLQPHLHKQQIIYLKHEANASLLFAPLNPCKKLLLPQSLSLSFKTSTSSCVIPLFGSKYFISKFIPITIEMPCKHIKIQSYQVNDKQSILQPKYIDVTMFETCDSAGDENERREGVERGPSLALIHIWLLLFMVISMLRRRGKRRCTSLLWVDVRTEPHLAVGAKRYRCRANCHRVRQHLLRLSR